MWIRNILLNALQVSAKADVRSVPVNFVYHNPTINALSEYVTQLANPSAALSESEIKAKKVKNMENMVEKYSKDFPRHVPSKPLPNSDTVVVTGTTGGLGSLLLVKLLQAPEVAKVYALNRSGSDLYMRHVKALEERGLDPAVLESSKLVMLDADYADPTLGLTEEVYETVRGSFLP
jgi:hypothetical protein